MKIEISLHRDAQDVAADLGGEHLPETTAEVVFEQASEEASVVATVTAGTVPIGILRDLDYQVCQMGRRAGRVGVRGRKTGLWTFQQD